MASDKGTIIITGSSGLIGYALAERLARRFNVVAFDRVGPPHPPARVETESVDVTDEENVRHSLHRVRTRHGKRLASIIHLAAYYDFAGGASKKYDEVTVRGTDRLLRHLQDFEVEQFIFSSTMLVHAPCKPGQRINEDWPLKPKWAYPKSKVKTEKLIRQKRGAIPVALLRIAGVYDDRCHSIPIAHQIQRIHEKRFTSRLFPGNPDHGQAFLHLDDLIDALVLLVERRHQLPAELPLVVGEPETVGYGELQRILGKLIHNEDWETKRIARKLAKTGAFLQDKLPLVGEPFIKPWMIDLADDHYALDISRIRRLTGWEPRRSLRDTLPKMVAALKADPLRWYQENDLKAASGLDKQPAEALSR